MKQPNLTVTIQGAWIGAVGNPAREFAGWVTASEVEQIPAGAQVRVNYSSPSERTHNATEHGTYILNFAGQPIQLMSFTCHSAITTGNSGHDDMQPAEWQAIPLPE